LSSKKDGKVRGRGQVNFKAEGTGTKGLLDNGKKKRDWQSMEDLSDLV